MKFWLQFKFDLDEINIYHTHPPPPPPPGVCNTKAIWHCYNCKPFSQWQCSFHMKAALPLAERLVTVSHHHKDQQGLGLMDQWWAQFIIKHKQQQQQYSAFIWRFLVTYGRVQEEDLHSSNDRYLVHQRLHQHTQVALDLQTENYFIKCWKLLINKQPCNFIRWTKQSDLIQFMHNSIAWWYHNMEMFSTLLAL